MYKCINEGERNSTNLGVNCKITILLYCYIASLVN